ncbi:DinB family protein [Actinokineospora xionganensis]|uniref:DinB family protein n=1 Tax=Actinokineospora xionganensis TaxID=2684470 RepID=A0ABR7L2Y1_9PSEU|nr:DinB family protein [Actinokineospora xionganensis]MBC6446937.1 DinB family protein [Actinokineospora xionganensis]
MDTQQRTEPSRIADERTSLTQFLDWQRQTLEMKVAGLTAEQLREKAVPPSAISLLGLVRHLAEVERSWFRVVVNGEQVPSYWGRGADGYHADFEVEDADVEKAFEVWREACAQSRAVVDGAESLDVLGRYGDEEYSLRYVLTHMIEEYARHNGHADFLRERLDGATGE